MAEEQNQIWISAEEFVIILKTGLGKVWDGYKWEKRDYRILKKGEPSKIVVSNAVVQGSVELSELELLNTQINLIQVFFENGVAIRRVRYDGIYFQNCEANEGFVFEEVTAKKEILFDKVRLKGALTLIQINSSLILVDVHSLDILHFSRNTESIDLTNVKTRQFATSGGTLSTFYCSKVKIQIVQIGSTKIETFSLDGSSISEKMSINSNFNNCSISDSTIGSLYVESSFKEWLMITGATIGSMYLKESTFKKIKLTHSNFHSLSILNDIPKDAALTVLNSRFKDTLFFSEMTNNGSIQLMDIEFEAGATLGVYYADLKKTDFINNNFSLAKFSFTNSKISECFFAETDFPSTVYSYIDHGISHEQAQLAFGQLQTAYYRQGDNVRASEYQSREIEAHYRTIDLFSKHFFTKINLFFNLISNNFGRNWAQGTLFSIAIGLLFFYFLVLSSDEFYFAWKFRSDLLDSFLKFMNPLRHFDTEAIFSDKQPQVTPNNWSYVWDFLGRIFVTYGYYQTIQAFRRFGKK
jgi:uncharacterized protein YjbI with pentapeptide repeats